MTTSKQTTEHTATGNTKRAAELRAGDTILVDGDPIQISHIQPVPDLGDGRTPRVLVVFADAKVITWRADVLAEVATAGQIAAKDRAARRGEQIADFRKLIDWLEARPEVPLPYTVTVQGSITGLPRAEQVAAAESFAQAHGVKVNDHTFDGGVAVSVDVEVGRYAKYTLYGQAKVPPVV
jgi:hypothetical protein